MKLCECGCGNPSPIAKHTSRRYGHVKGEPVRFIVGHGNRTKRGPLAARWAGGRQTNGRYVQVYAPDHPRACPRGTVPEHLLVVEHAMGKFLVQPHEVHHVNERKHDNRPANLVACEDRAYHGLLHQRARALAACGRAGWRKCYLCKQYDDPQNLYAPAGRAASPFHRTCHARRQRLARRAAA